MMLRIVGKRHCLATEQSEPGSRKSDICNDEGCETVCQLIRDKLTLTLNSLNGS